MILRRQARRAVASLFFIAGALYAAFLARAPEVRDHAGVSNTEMGIVLALGAVGSMLAIPVAGYFASRYGSRRIARLALAGLCAGILLPPLTSSFMSLAMAVSAAGAFLGALDVAMNTHGIAVEKAYRRPIISGLHASYSFGGIAGAGLAALAAAAGMSVLTGLAILAATALATGIVWSRRLLSADVDAAGGGQLLVRPPRALWILGAIAHAAWMSEGAAGEWSAVYMSDSLASSPATAALALTVFSFAMAFGRLGGDRLVSRLGGIATVRVGGLVAALGFGSALLIHTASAALLGFACLGIGLSLIMPVVIRAAGTHPGMAPGIGLATVESIGSLGFILGPPIIGTATDKYGVRIALLVVVLLTSLVVLLARSTGLGAAGSLASTPLIRG